MTRKRPIWKSHVRQPLTLSLLVIVTGSAGVLPGYSPQFRYDIWSRRRNVVQCTKYKVLKCLGHTLIPAKGKTKILSKEDWWQLLLSCVLALCDVQRYEEAELMVESAMEFYSFYDIKPRRKELEFLGLSASILDRDHHKAYNYIRFEKRMRSSVRHFAHRGFPPLPTD